MRLDANAMYRIRKEEDHERRFYKSFFGRSAAPRRRK
jgi:hypothetical protein